MEQDNASTNMIQSTAGPPGASLLVGGPASGLSTQTERGEDGETLPQFEVCQFFNPVKYPGDPRLRADGISSTANPTGKNNGGGDFQS